MIQLILYAEGAHLQVLSGILLRRAGKIKCEDLKRVTEESEVLRVEGVHMRSIHLYSSWCLNRLTIFVWR